MIGWHAACHWAAAKFYQNGVFFGTKSLVKGQGYGLGEGGWVWVREKVG